MILYSAILCLKTVSLWFLEHVFLNSELVLRFCTQCEKSLRDCRSLRFGLLYML